MKNIFIIFIFTNVTFQLFSQEVDLTSIFSFNINNINSVRQSVIFDDSIVYSIGGFENSLNIEGTVITTTSNRGVYLLKTTIDNEFIWLKKILDNDFNVHLEPNFSLNVDSYENIIIGSCFRDKIYYFNDSIVVNNGGNNIGTLLLKIDRDANLVWGKYLEDKLTGKQSVTIDYNNNILVSGGFQSDFFITKYNESGDSLWTKTGGSSNSNVPVSGGSITSDSLNNYYCSGFLTTSNIVYFDSEHPVFNPIDLNKYGSFLVKYDSSGAIQWLKCLFASSEQIQFAPINSIDYKDGNILIGGYYNSNYLKSSPNEGTLGSSNPFGLNRGFLILYDTNGTRLWSKITHTDENGKNEVCFVQFVDEGGLYVTSNFSETLVVDGVSISGGSAGDILIEKYSINGSLEGYFFVKGQNKEIQSGFFKIGNDFFLMGSTDSNPIYFNNTPYSLATNPSFYIAKLHDNSVSVNEMGVNIFSISPNPTSGNVELQSQNSLKGEEVMIYNTLGEIVTQQILNTPFSNELTIPEHPGVYFVCIGSKTMKVVRQ